MTIFKNNNPSDAVASAVTGAKVLVAEAGSELISQQRAGMVLSVESFDSPNYQEAQHFYTDTEQQIRGIFDAAQLSVDSISMESATQTAIALGDMGKYNEHLGAPAPAGALVANGVMRGAHGTVNESLSMEAFEDRDYSNFKAESVVFSAFAGKRSEFEEELFPTKVVGAETVGLTSTITSDIVLKNVHHPITGAIIDTGEQSIAHALVDASILANESTKVVPAVATDDSNVSHFVPNAEVPHRDIKIDDVSVKTAHLLFDKDHGLLGLADSAIAGRVSDVTDMLVPNIQLESVLLKVTYAGASAVVSYIDVPVKSLPGTSFIQSVEGQSNDVVLNFDTSAIVLNKGTLDVTGVAAPALDVFDATDLLISAKISGKASCKTSKLNLFAGGVGVAAAYDDSNVELSLTSGATAVEVAKLTIEAAGFKTQQYRTNSNLKVTGIMSDTSSRTVFFPLAESAPVYRPVPTSSEDTGSVVRGLLRICNARSHNNAVTALLNHRDAVAAFATATHDLPASEVFVGACDEVKGYFKSIPMNLVTDIDSEKTHEKASDLRHVFVNTLTQHIAVMIDESNYRAALDLTSNGMEKPRVVIATDPIIASWLSVQGDERLLGDAVDAKVVSTTDSRMKGKIIVVLQREKTDGVDPLSFACRGYAPDAISTIQVSRDGGTVKEIMVKPRESHIAVLPILIEFLPTGLTEVLTTSVG